MTSRYVAYCVLDGLVGRSDTAGLAFSFRGTCDSGHPEIELKRSNAYRRANADNRHLAALDEAVHRCTRDREPLRGVVDAEQQRLLVQGVCHTARLQPPFDC